MYTVVCHQSIIHTFGEIPRPFPLYLPRTYEVEAKHAPHGGMTRSLHVVYEQRRFGRMEQRVVRS